MILQNTDAASKATDFSKRL